MGWSLLDLVAPAGCLVCDQRGDWLCASCASRLTVQQLRTATGLLVVATAGRQFVPAVTRWKDGGIRAATPTLAGRLASAAGLLADRPTAVVTVPGRLAATARRGWQPGVELGRCVADLLAADFLPLLKFDRQPGDQRGLTDRQRRANLAGSLTAQSHPGKVLLVDDVLTGGSTLSAAHEALRAAGVLVVGAVVLAASRNRTS